LVLPFFLNQTTELPTNSDSSESETDSQQKVGAKRKRTYKSRRRLVTDVEVKMALTATEGFQSSRPYFLKQMKAANVYKYFTVVRSLVRFSARKIPLFSISNWKKKTAVILTTWLF
jgi:biopolymer transport protein ExbD